MVLSAVSAVVGAVLGAFLAYLIVTRPADQPRAAHGHGGRGVLAQFGGVSLAFAFIATLGFTGLRHRGAPRDAWASTSTATAGSTRCPG